MIKYSYKGKKATRSRNTYQTTEDDSPEPWLRKANSSLFLTTCLLMTLALPTLHCEVFTCDRMYGGVMA